LQASVSDIAQRAAAASAAALLSITSLAGSALASEFDILAEPTPTKTYFVDDASVLSKATRSDLNKRLSILEVSGGIAECMACNALLTWQEKVLPILTRSITGASKHLRQGYVISLMYMKI
jgi:hypothetical protein